MLHLYKPKTIIIDVQKKKICTSTMVLKYRDSKHTIFYYFPWLLKFLDLTLIRYIIVWTLFFGGGDRSHHLLLPPKKYLFVSRPAVTCNNDVI